MTTITGLFSRGSSYYLRVVLPKHHPATQRYRSGKIVLSLGPCGKREAMTKATLLRAQVLNGELPGRIQTSPKPLPAQGQIPALGASRFLRDVFEQWRQAKPRSADTVAACRRALSLYEEQTGNPPLPLLTRAAGVAFKSWLQQPERGTTSKTARDRLVWVKSLIKHAHVELEWIGRHPWEGLDIEQITTNKRRPWCIEELTTLFSQPLHARHEVPSDRMAGAHAAYWLPIMGLFTGARLSELAQLRPADIEAIGGVWVLSIANAGEDQRVKTVASVRKVPIHSELIRLGFIEYVRRLPRDARSLWPALPLRDGKSGGFFSHWFGKYRRRLGLGKYPDFHCFRHTVRSALADAEIAEPMIDLLVGHEIKGSTGAKVYTHRTVTQLKTAIEKITYPGLLLPSNGTTAR